MLCILSALVFVAPVHHAAASAELTKDVAIGAGPLVKVRNQPFMLIYGDKKWTVTAAQASTFYKTRSSDGQTLLQLRPGAIYDFLNTRISPSVNDLGEKSLFETVNGNVHLISGGRKGKIVDGVKTSLAIRAALVAGKTSASVSTKEYRPANFSAEDFEKLSFPTLLTSGESNFAGSPKNRVHNIQVAQKRYHGLVLMPGEEFSFNAYLGQVDQQNGYVPELVIKDNVTTPEFGGGICQVSTTAFRAALQAGLKITSRQNHSYPVAYYGTPGYDATVYQPAPDLRFSNDRDKPVYFKTKIVGTKLIFEVWGTNDGRAVKVNGPFVTEKKTDGSLTAAVAQIVTKNGKTIREQNFVSKYQSPDKFPTVRKANGE